MKTRFLSEILWGIHKIEHDLLKIDETLSLIFTIAKQLSIDLSLVGERKKQAKFKTEDHDDMWVFVYLLFYKLLLTIGEDSDTLDKLFKLQNQKPNIPIERAIYDIFEFN